MFRVGLLLTAGVGGVAALRFARNILLARLISVEDYGIASLAIVVVSFIALVADLALDRLIIQDRRGEEPRFVAAVQAVVLARAVVLSVLMVLAAHPTAVLFGLPELAWMFQLLALVPLLQGFAHPDLFRHQRVSDFRPLIVSDLAGVAASLAAMFPLALLLGDFRVMPLALIIEQAVRTLVSFRFAERPFRVAWDGAIALQAVRFGAPLVLSGLAVFAITHGERILVASNFTVRDLGIFSAALTLAFTPGQLLATVQQRYFLPQLARAAETPGELARRANEALRLTLASAAGFALAAFAFGPEVLVLVFGDRFAEAGAYVALIALIASLRAMRSGPTVIALSGGHTLDILAANVIRLLALPLAVLVVARGGSIADILFIAWLGETCALVFAYGLLAWRGTPLTWATWATLLAALLMTAILAAALAGGDEHFNTALLLASPLFVAMAALWYAARRPA